MSKTINLLPAARRQQIRQEAVFGALMSLIWISIFSFLVVIAAQFGVKLYLQNQAASINDSIQRLQSQDNKQENTTIKQQIGDINNLIADYKTLAVGIPKWSKMVKAFAVLPPAGVTITSFNVDFSTHQIIITGTSPTRELVIQLYNNILADNAEFYNLDYPLENVARPTNISFHFEFTVRDSVLQ